VNWVPKNLAWKVGSLALAIMLWIAFSPREDAVTERVAPVVYRNLGRGMWLTQGDPDTLTLQLRGPSRQLTAASLSDVVVAVDLESVTAPTERTLTISSQNVDLPGDVSLVRAVPSQIRVRIDRRQVKSVPVDPAVMGELPDGFRLISKSVHPEQLNLLGGEERLQSVTHVVTDPIRLTGLTQTTEFQVSAVVGDGRLQFESPATVAVRLEIGPAAK